MASGEVKGAGGRPPAAEEAALFLAALPTGVQAPSLDELVTRMHGTQEVPIVGGPIRPEAAAIPLGVNAATALRAAMATRPR